MKYLQSTFLDFTLKLHVLFTKLKMTRFDESSFEIHRSDLSLPLLQEYSECLEEKKCPWWKVEGVKENIITTCGISTNW